MNADKIINQKYLNKCAVFPFILKGKEIPKNYVIVSDDRKFWLVKNTPDWLKLVAAPVVGVNIDYTLQTGENQFFSIDEEYLVVEEKSIGRMIKGDTFEFYKYDGTLKDWC